MTELWWIQELVLRPGGVGGVEEWRVEKLDAGVVRRLRLVIMGLCRLEQGCSTLAAPTKNCTPLMLVCSLIGSTLDSACRCGIGVDLTQPVAMRRAAFWVRWSAAICVGAKSLHQAGLAYSSTSLMNCLYSAAWASF